MGHLHRLPHRSQAGQQGGVMYRPAFAPLALAGLFFLSACGTPLDPYYEMLYVCPAAEFYCAR
ncbi:hypothetical protein Barb4_02810 [Bacteroidales bacterium Barb4]|nr:hypothetical protein Barb4_02810 [Bacteroidales bacterium Barb4]